MENLDSQFIEEIEEELLERRGMYRPRNIIIEKPYHRETRAVPKEPYDFVKSEKTVHLGDKIMHKTFGKGVVVDISQDKVTVAFKSPTGIKILLKDHPSYEIMESKNG